MSKTFRLWVAITAAAMAAPALPVGQEKKAEQQAPPITQPKPIKLADIRMRDVCILPDQASKTYYMVGPAGPGAGVRAYTSKDLSSWQGPQKIFTAPRDMWGDIPVVSVWAPELHLYKGKYYLFLTFDTRNLLPEQWRDWRPRVTRGSQILVSDSPTGPFKGFQKHSTTPVDMMTLDGTLWVEDGVPYMVFCHEWVQITIGTIDYMKLEDDLSGAAGEPKRLFDANSASWSKKGGEGCYVTDGPYLYKSKSGKLFMIWSSFGSGGYTTGIAISASGKLAGPWTQQAEPIYAKDGGHGMIFTTFEGKLMMVLHSPNNSKQTRPRIFELEDTGETLRIDRRIHRLARRGPSRCRHISRRSTGPHRGSAGADQGDGSLELLDGGRVLFDFSIFGYRAVQYVPDAYGESVLDVKWKISVYLARILWPDRNCWA